jgi:hypothetical protein
MVKKDDWPRYVEEETEVCERAELDTLFAGCDAKERLWFEFFLMTGMREQEVIHMLVGCEPRSAYGAGEPQAAIQLDPEGIQGTGDSHPREAGGEPASCEDGARQNVRPSFAYLTENCDVPVRHIVAPGAMGKADPWQATSRHRAEPKTGA